MKSEKEDFDGWRGYTVQDVINQLGTDAKECDIFELGAVADAYHRILIEKLKAGEIPCLSEPDFEAKTIRFTPVVTPVQLKSLWQVFTGLTDEEMDKRIKNSHLYDNEEGFILTLPPDDFDKIWSTG